MKKKYLLQLSAVILLSAIMAGSFEISSALVSSSNKMSIHEYMARFAEYKK